MHARVGGVQREREAVGVAGLGEEILGEVDVPSGEDRLAEINSDDVVPPAFYLVVVEDAVEECQGFSGAWPVGFVRAGGTTTEPATPAPQG